METTKFNFTDNKLSKLVHDGGNKRIIYFDTGQHGLALQLTRAGTKTFQFRYWDRGRKKTVIKTIAGYPASGISQARQMVVEYISDTINGVDVVEKARAIKDEDTFEVLFKRWLNEHAKPHKKSWVRDEQQYDLYIKGPFGTKKLSWFSAEKIRKWHSDILKIKRQRGNGLVGIYAANRALALVSTVFNQMRPDCISPTRGVKKFKEKSRDRFFKPEELKRFFKALVHPNTPEYLRDYALFSMLTGARRGNVMSLRWSEIDFNNSVWTIPAEKSKNGEPMDVPLVDTAVEILVRRKFVASSVFVFPGPGKTGHLMEPKKAWKALLERAKVTDFRIHDLRRTMGSYQTMSGASSTIVGKTLGHKSQAATAVYARLNLDPVRSSMEAAVEMMMATKDMPEKIVGMKKESK